MTNLKKIIVLLLLVPLSSVVIANIRITAVAQVNVDADNDGLTDKQEDINSNQIVDSNETDYNDPDTDKDGTNDGDEIKAGTNPLDYNSSPLVLPVEIDANSDGVPDKDFTDAELLANFNLVKVTTSTLGAGASCNEPTVVLDTTVLDCVYPLNPSNKKYTFGAVDYKVQLDSSNLQTRCSIEDNGKPTAFINCKSIAFEDAATLVNKVSLIVVNYNKDVEYLNDSLTVNVKLDPNLKRINELNETQDLTLERNCIPVESYKPTTCTFKLPKNTILPPQYSMGLATDPDGFCVQTKDTNMVECKDVPTGESSGITEVSTTLNSQVTYRALVASIAQEGHLEDDQTTIPTVKFITNTELKTIDNIDTGYNGGVILRIFNGNGDVIKSVTGKINLDKTFTPDEMTLLNFQTLPVGSYKAVFESLEVTPNSLKLNYEILLEILDNTPTNIGIVKKTDPALTRTGGVEWVSIVAFGFVSLLLVILLIYNRSKLKKFKIHLIVFILFSIFATSLGVTQELIQANAQIVSIAAKPLTAFSNYSCNPKIVEIGQKVNCTMDLTNPNALPANQTIVSYVDISPSTQTFSKPCHPYSGTKWVCRDQYVNSIFFNGNATNTLPIKIGAISYYNKGVSTITPTHTAGVVQTLNTLQVANVGTVSTYVSDLNAISSSGYINSDVDIRYGSVTNVPANQNVYFTIRDRYTNAAITSNILATRTNAQSFTANVLTSSKALWRIEACVGTSALTCKAVQKKTDFDVLPIMKAIGVFPETNKNADRINLVFSCDNTFTSTQACKDSIVAMMAWDGQAKPTDWQGNIVAGNKATTVQYGVFATEPFKSNKNKFNVLYLDNLVDNFDKRILLDNLSNDGVNPNSSIILRLHNISARSYASFPPYGDKPVLTKADMNLQPFVTREDLGIVEQFIGVNGNDTKTSGKVIAHELGHAIFGLRDEYVEANSKIIVPGYPNCQNSSALAVTAWTALTGLSQGQLNGNVDQAYYDWVADQKKYSNGSYNLGNNAFLAGNRAADYATGFNIQGGCFGPTTGNIFRPTQVSMMSNTSPVFGTVNRARAQKVLDQFAGTSVACSNTASNPPACNVFPPCTNTATNPPLCDNQVVVVPPKICSNGATNPPKCDKIPVCANGATNSPTCTKFNPCTNRATNPPACDALPNNLIAFCPNGATFDLSIGFCASATEVYGPFPRAIVDRCVKQFPNDKSCTGTRLVTQNGINFNVNVYPKSRFLTFRGKGQCSFGTSLSTVVKGGYCYESDTDNPADPDSNANVFGPFTKTVFESCKARKGGNACSLNRYSYKFFKQLAQ
jgi:IgA Peptidase M64